MNAKTTKCKHCGAPIKWFVTKEGKKMPVQPDARDYWIKEKGKCRIVLPTGDVLACEYEGEGKPSGQGYVPHWASCIGNKKSGGK